MASLRHIASRTTKGKEDSAGAVSIFLRYFRFGVVVGCLVVVFVGRHYPQMPQLVVASEVLRGVASSSAQETKVAPGAVVVIPALAKEEHSAVIIPKVVPSPSRLDAIKGLTSEKYEKFITKPAGSEHYALLHYLSTKYGDSNHVVVDIGTRFVTSSLALASGGSPVHTFDLPGSTERRRAFRGKLEEEWQAMVQKEGLSIRFFNVDLLSSKPDLTQFIPEDTWLILLDTFHEPDTVPFEREWLDMLLKINFRGMLLLDDIYLNGEMKRWWKEVQDLAETRGYRTFDLSRVGHSSGTGLLDFSGRVQVEWEQGTTVA